jgi:hypothetical protein
MIAYRGSKVLLYVFAIIVPPVSVYVGSYTCCVKRLIVRYLLRGAALHATIRPCTDDQVSPFTFSSMYSSSYSATFYQSSMPSTSLLPMQISMARNLGQIDQGTLPVLMNLALLCRKVILEYTWPHILLDISIRSGREGDILIPKRIWTPGGQSASWLDRGGLA